MSVLRPAYRLRVYQPQSLSATETAVLAPSAGAPHADAFQVATIAGVAGYQPYLFPPAGRRGGFDVLTKRVDTGEMTFELFDTRVPAGTNAQRWFTAFAGDTEGRPLMLNCRVEVDESLDGGGVWSPFFAGRVEEVRLSDVLHGTLTVREESARFEEQIFTGRPLSSISYARTQAALPIQPPPLPGIAYRRMPGTSRHNSDALWRIEIGSGVTVAAGNVISSGLESLAISSNEGGYSQGTGAGGYAESGFFYYFGVRGTPAGVTTITRARLRALVFWSGGSGEYPVYEVASRTVGGQRRPNVITLGTYASGEPGYAVRPTAALAVTVVLVVDAAATSSAPIIVDNVNPLTLWQDVLAGKFSRLSAAGAVRHAIPAATAAFTALAAARDFLPINAVISKTMTIRDFVETFLLKPYHLGYRMAPDGSVTPFDCRRDASLASVPQLGLADLARPADGFEWAQRLSDAVGEIRVEAYRDLEYSVEYLLTKTNTGSVEAATGLVKPTSFTVIDANPAPRALDLTGRELVVQAPGWRSRSDGTGRQRIGGNTATATALKQEELIIAAAVSLAGQIRSLLGGGGTYLVRAFRRSTAGDVLPGMWRRLTVAESPNAATLVRGGERVGLCVDRLESGMFVTLTFLDAGATSLATVPTLATLANGASGETSVTITLNAAVDPVLVQVAVTAQSVATAPTADWQDAGMVTESGVALLVTPAAGMRLWVRGRSEPRSGGDDFRLPSAFVSPSPAFINTGTVVAPTTLYAATITQTTIDLRWTLTDLTLPVEIAVGLGNYYAGLFDDTTLVVKLLPPGTSRYFLGGLDGPVVAQCCGVRHVHPTSGRVSAWATLDFSTLSAGDTSLPTPLGITIVAP